LIPAPHKSSLNGSLPTHTFTTLVLLSLFPWIPIYVEGGVYWRLKSSLDLITEQLQLVRPPLEAIQPQTVFAEIGPILNVKI